jgi:hypothetical protein
MNNLTPKQAVELAFPRLHKFDMHIIACRVKWLLAEGFVKEAANTYVAFTQDGWETVRDRRKSLGLD